MWITRVSIDNPVFAAMLMIALTVLGLAAYSRLNVEQMPDVTLPYVVVVTAYPGASPEAVENDVSKPLEYAINTVAGVSLIRSNSRDGRSEVLAEFRMATDMTRAMQDVRDKVAQVRPGFPREVKDPLVMRVDQENTQPVVTLSITSQRASLRDLTSLTDQVIVKALENVPGVARIDVSGRATRQILVRVKPGALVALGMRTEQVMAAIRAANQDIPAGRITRDSTDTSVRIEGRIGEPAQFGRIIVARQAGAPVYLAQVADVLDTEKDETSFARTNGVPSLTLDIQKSQDANVVTTAAGVREAIALLKGRLPGDVSLNVVHASADSVEAGVDRLEATLIEGAALTVLIVFLFLGSWRSTVITALTLPIAVIATFIALYAFGFTLNFLTLMALSLCIGLLIDDAIVVRENIVRHASMGKDLVAAAREGTDEIGLAVMATTFAIVAVFVPIAFMSGLIGRFFLQFGVTVAVAVLVSLFVSFTLDPMLSSIWHDAPVSRFSRVPRLRRAIGATERAMASAHAIYDRVLRWALSHRAAVLAIAIVAFVGSFAIVPLVGTEFIPEADEGFLSLRLNTPVGSSLQYTDSKVRQVEAALTAFPEIALVAVNVGTEDGRNYARINLRLVDVAQRRRSQKEIERAIRSALRPIAGIELAFGFDRPVWVNLLGPDPRTLTALIEEFARKVAQVPGIADLEISEKAASPALSIRLNDAAADAGIDVEQVGALVRPLFAGETVSYWLAPDGQNYEVNVQLPKEARRVPSDLANLQLVAGTRGADGEARMVPLRQVAAFVHTTSPQVIKRQALQRRVALYANVEGRPSGDVNADVRRIMDATTLPAGYRFDVGGQAKDMQELFRAALAALALGIVFIYLILGSQFASFTDPLAIMASLPLSLAGVLLALLFSGSTLNLFSMIGLIMLMGLVTKNAILLVDFAKRARRDGASTTGALLAAGQVRLRPILMTTAAMLSGMLPLALGLGNGGELQAPMGRAIMGGVITSTLLTLIVVPVLYSYLQTWTRSSSARIAVRSAGTLRAAALAIARAIIEHGYRAGPLQHG